MGKSRSVQFSWGFGSAVKYHLSKSLLAAQGREATGSSDDLISKTAYFDVDCIFFKVKFILTKATGAFLEIF